MSEAEETKRTRSCRDCGGLVSVSAQSCPHCGAHRPAVKRGLSVKVLAALFVAPLTCAGWLVLSFAGPFYSAEERAVMAAVERKAGACEKAFSIKLGASDSTGSIYAVECRFGHKSSLNGLYQAVLKNDGQVTVEALAVDTNNGMGYRAWSVVADEATSHLLPLSKIELE